MPPVPQQAATLRRSAEASAATAEPFPAQVPGEGKSTIGGSPDGSFNLHSSTGAFAAALRSGSLEKALCCASEMHSHLMRTAAEAAADGSVASHADR